MLYMETFEGECVYLTYTGFVIQDADEYYLLNSSLTPLYTPDTIISDTMRTMEGANFTTHDQDNDINDRSNCGVIKASGWWFTNCGQGNFNGPYGVTDCTKCGIFYRGYKGDDVTYRRVAMKIRDPNYTV